MNSSNELCTLTLILSLRERTKVRASSLKPNDISNELNQSGDYVG
jgi:hypothetical protein